MSEDVKWDDLVEKFSESVGKEKAKELVEKAAENTSGGKKNEYTKDEATELLDEIKELDDSTTYVNIAANTMKTNLNTEGTL
jgi:hypothetical protein